MYFDACSASVSPSCVDSVRVKSSSSFSFFSICLSCSVYSSTTLLGTSGYSWYEVSRKTPASE